MPRHNPSDPRYTGGPESLGEWFLSNCLVIGIVLIVFLFLLVLWIPTQLGARRPAWAARAKGTLRSIGSAQLAYQSANDRRVYGSFQALQNVEDIATGYTLGNMIENYSMTWEANTVSTTPTEEFPSGLISTFTVIAYPHSTRYRHLQTFAITEDMLVRVYNPRNGNDPVSVRTWDPIL